MLGHVDPSCAARAEKWGQAIASAGPRMVGGGGSYREERWPTARTRPWGFPGPPLLLDRGENLPNPRDPRPTRARIQSTDVKNAALFKGGVGYARRADRLNRHFVGVGRAPTSMAENVLRDDLIEAPKMTQHRSQIWET